MIKISTFNSRSVLIKEVKKPQIYLRQLAEKYNDLIDVVPSFSEVLLVFKNDIMEYEKLEGELKELMKQETSSLTSNTLRIPICFDEDFGLDQKRVEEYTGIPRNEVIKTLCNSSFQVHFLGFLPGYAYMGDLDSSLKIPRLESPRPNVPKGSFAIAENQLGIYPNASPGGWNIIGNCPLKIFDVESEELTLFKPGDQVQFYSISREEHEVFSKGSLDRKTFEL